MSSSEITPGRPHRTGHKAFADYPAQLLKDGEVPADEDVRRILCEFNDTAVAFPDTHLIHEFFEEQAGRRPNAIAVVYEGRTVTFEALNRQANQVARYLRNREVGLEELVGLYFNRSPEMIVALLGILKAGGAYVPLDPTYPVGRLCYMIADASPRIVLTQECLCDSLRPSAAEFVALDKELTTIAQYEETNIEPATLGLTNRHLAYVIYTSGSTGQPKGVAAEHRGMVNRIFAQASIAAFSVDEVCCQKTSIGFVDAVFEILGPLSYGCPLILAPSSATSDPVDLAKLIRTQWVTWLWSVPSLAQALLDSEQAVGDLQNLRTWTLSGEVLTERLACRLKKALPKCQFLNIYGASEVGPDATYYSLDGYECGPISIGQPIANTKIYILDEQCRPVPIGVQGEIYVAGVGLAREYLHRPELTELKFINDPNDGRGNGRMYQTGDLGRWRSDGTIMYLGRKDRQAKVRGCRVELEEIETHILHDRSVREAAVLATDDPIGGTQLVAYLVPCEGTSEVSNEAIRESLRHVLPGFMIPSAFVTMNGFPRTPSGKLDWRALPAPDSSAYLHREYEPPQGAIEEVLAGIWQQLLQLERVGRRDNFLELGGHSLMLVKMKERLRRAGLSAEVRQMLERPTLTDMAECLVRGVAGDVEVPPNQIQRGCEILTPDMLPLIELDAENIERIVQSVPGGAANIQDVYPLTPLQEGMLFHHLLEGQGGDAYVVSTLLRVGSREQLENLIAALQCVIDRHDILRTAVLWKDLGRPVQVVYRQATLPVEQMELDRSRDATEQLLERMSGERWRMDLRLAPLMRVQIAAEPGSECWYAMAQTHHMVCDAESVQILLAETGAHLEGSARELADPVPYRNHVAQALAYGRAHDAQAFFQGKLRDIDEPTAPFGLLDVHGDGSQILEARADLEEWLARHVRMQARRLGVSPAILFHAAWALVVCRTSAREDVVFGTVLLGRMQGSAGAERILGVFINALPLRISLQDLTATTLVERAQRELLELLDYEQASLAEAQRCSGIGGATPLFTTLLNYRHSAPRMGSEWWRAKEIDVLGEYERTNYPITVSVDDWGDGFTVTAQTDHQIAPEQMLAYVRTAMASLVRALEQDGEQPALALEVLPDNEWRQVVQLFNRTHTDYPREKLIHELFEEQVERAPNAIAVVYEGRSLTYAGLNAKANQVAWFLKDRGLRVGEYVPIFMRRCPEMLIAQLAVLKAGGAYMPIDPELPAQRREFIIRDCGARLILGDSNASSCVECEGIELIDCGVIAASEEGCTAINLNTRMDPVPVAYVMYTSGSTGDPKGVIVPHHAVVRLVINNGYAQIGSSDCLVHHSNPAFDASTFETWGALLNGARMVVVPQAVVLEGQRFANVLKEHGASLLWMSVGLFNRYAEVFGEVFGSLRYLIVGGDVLDPKSVQRVLRESPPRALLNGYGPTECTTFSTTHLIQVVEEEAKSIPIGRPMANAQIYVLGGGLAPVPIGVVGEIYIGGDGVARGYLNRRELTAERFVADPFSSASQARMYKTGDLGRWRPDGAIEYVGRNDHQVKIRGFRIELGEIEAQIRRQIEVKEAVVIAREGEWGEKRLVAYMVPIAAAQTLSAEVLRERLKRVLPDYMVPSAFVILEAFPLTPNGKLDRRALPAPQLGAYTSRQYEEPLGEVEEILAGIWQSLLKVERVGRNDNFFELGGHSLLIVQMMDRLRRVGLSAEVRRAFESPTLGDLASALTRGAVSQIEVPANRIPPECGHLLPEMLPLIELEPEHLEQIVRTVPGGAANVQDIYPLAPLQEGLLFHHLLDRGGGDTYVLPTLLSVCSRQRLEELISALQAVIDRHDILRTAVLWEGLPRPVQVVYRRAKLPVEEVTLHPDQDREEEIRDWLRPERQRLELRQAPLMRLQIAADPNKTQYYALLQVHHVTIDHVAIEIVLSEVMAHLEGRAQQLPQSVPYRNHVAQALAYAKMHDAQAFFHGKLGEVEEATAPFGLLDVYGDGSQIEEAHEELELLLAQRLRVQARRLSVSAATLFHAAWGLVLAHTSGREDVVYGTVLLGRLQGSAGAQRTLGVFINTLPLRLSTRGVTVKQLVEQTQRELVDLLAHEQASLAEAQRCSGMSGSAPLFTSLLNYRHSAQTPEAEWSKTSGISALASQEWTNYPVTLSVDDLGQGFAITALTDRRISSQRMVRYLATAVRSLVQKLEETPQVPAHTLQVLPMGEQQQVLDLFNATQAEYPEEKLIHELFEEQARRTPDGVAVEHGGRQLTYKQLNRRANQLARYLLSQGVGPDQVVGICMERGLEMVVGLLGILKAGGAYLPLDPNYPTERLKQMLEDAGPQVVLTQTELMGALPASDAKVMALDEKLNAISGFVDENIPGSALGLTSQHLVYVIYTSGSTGRPKGTAMRHRSMVNLIEWHRSAFGPGDEVRVLQFAALSFDVAFQETFSTLCTGGTLVLVDEWVRRDAKALTELLIEQSIHRLFVPPLMLQGLAEHANGSLLAPEGLRDVIVAGEQLRVSSEVRDFFRRLEGCRLHNHYGPTETHVVTAFTLAGDPGQWPVLPPIGRPIANTQIYVLDGQMQPVPIGVAGEIYIGGANVARGYLKRPDLTEQRFVVDPYSASSLGRLYKTGDLGRWRGDATLEYLGRNDHQVKIRGFRIELGDIEAQLACHPEVREAAVLAREEVPGEKRLVAYVTAREERLPSSEDLRTHLKALLPEHMVPSAFVVLEKLPLTPSGKLDRRALPAPSLGSYVSREYEPPRGEVEEILTGIWQELLRIERVSRHDNFFELGGHSLLIVQMMDRLRRLGLSAEVRRVFESPTLSDLAGTLVHGDGAKVQVPPTLIPQGCRQITPDMLTLVELEPEHIECIAQSVPGGAANIQDIYPLAPLQEGMLFHHLLDQRSGDIYVVPTLFSLSSREKLDAFIEALRKVVGRHDVLRTAVLWEHLPRPVQVVYRCAEPVIEEIQLDSARPPIEQLKERMKPERQTLDLRRAPLIRLQMAVDTRSGVWYAILQIHHLLCDHESLETLYAEVAAHLRGTAQTLPEAGAYRTHVAEAVEYARLQDSEGFFRSRLAQVDAPTTPFGLQNVHGDASCIIEAQQLLDVDFAMRIRRQARRLGVSAATLFHAAWALVVSRTSGKDDVVFGTVLLGRMHGSAGAQRILGMFMNTLPLRLTLDAALTARALVENTQKELVQLLGHEQASLAVAQRCSAITGAAPLFSALLNYRHSVRKLDTDLEDLGLQTLDVVSLTNYPITLSVDDFGDEFGLVMDTDRRVSPERMLAYVTTAMRSLVEALERGQTTPARTLQVLPIEEQRRVLQGFNPIQMFSQEKLIHELFEAQVRLRPEAIAAVYEGQSMTYGELNAKANQVAWYLMGRGVGVGQLVGICVERGLDMVVGLLGILKAGGAYLPLDPTYPLDRLAFMLEDAAPAVVLTQERLIGRLPRRPIEMVALDAHETAIGKHLTSNPALRPQGLSSEHLAYVIYTSGSTGKPKGVTVEHRNVVRLFAATEACFGFQAEDVWTLFHSMAFDFSVWELWGALLSGGRVVVVPYLTARSPEEFYRLICRERVTILNQTPSAFVQLIDAQVELPILQHTLRAVIFGGEALECRSLRPWVERNGATHPQLVNMYGITETTVHVTYRLISAEEVESERGNVIGRPLPDLHIYLLDRHGQPAPIGVAAEIYVGGAGLARGYLNRPELTAERFLPDPYSTDANARMYKSGDLGRWRADGTVEYLGRNDDQVKIRGFRIELGEIETELARHPVVKEAVVVAREDIPGDKRLVAYVIPKDSPSPDAGVVETLREFLKRVLPDYMMPSALVTLGRLPLTANGKLNREALPAPELSSYVSREYEAPQGEVEQILAGIWEDLLRVERVGRHDNFFELGGHSLLIVQMMERLRRVGFAAEVRRVFESPTLADLARALTQGMATEVDVPLNQIPFECEHLTPEMLPLVELEPEHLERIVQSIPGGSANVQDIYPLAPLQEGILFHSQLASEGRDTYVLTSLLTVSSRDRLEALIAALRAVIDRHDVLRTSVLWEKLPLPVQVVHRRVTLPVQEVALDPERDPQVQIRDWMKSKRQQHMDLRQAPLMRLIIAAEPYSSKWYAILQLHHLVCDNVSLDSMLAEVVALLEGRSHELPVPVPYRRHLAEVQAHVQAWDAETFFRGKLAEVLEPTAPFGLLDVHGDGSRIDQAEQILDPELARNIRAEARRLGVSAATLFHSAWALVVARASSRGDVVYGTVLLGRFQGSAGARRTLGMFINTLPLRLKLYGLGARQLIEQTQRELIQLLTHEQASLAMAQRASGVPGSAPLFTCILNYRHGAVDLASNFTDRAGVTLLASQAWTNYPIMLSVDELPESFALTADTDRDLDPKRLLAYMQTALSSLVEALRERARTAVLDLGVLPETERHELLMSFNATQAEYPEEKLIHELFEEQARRTPDGVAVEHGGRQLTYKQLNRRANQLARYLLSQGVGPDQVVGICMERGLEMVVGLLGILKAGGAYLPLDPNYPTERLKQMLEDAGPQVVLTQTELMGALPASDAKVMALDEKLNAISGFVDENIPGSALGLTSQHLVYVIYTSGSTGRPKGTAMRHRSMVNLIEWHRSAFGPGDEVRVLQFAALSFDVAFQETFSTLCTGGTLVLVDEWVRRDAKALTELLIEQSIHRLFVPPLMLQGLAEHANGSLLAPEGLRDVIVAGEQLRVSSEVRDFFRRLEGCRLHNHYGPTETHVVTAFTLAGDPGQWPVLPPIGRPIANTQIYVLDGQMQPVPIGVAGEIYIGGANVARGYLKRPDLTEQRFVVDPYSASSLGRLYKTGDLGRWRGDATLEYLGRNDHQVKIRGFRIELGDIEAQLACHPEVREAAVLAREEVPGEKRLVAYVTAREERLPSSEDLRTHLKALLPEHMVPSAFVVLEKLPLTPSGKLDRRALPAPSLGSYVSREYEPPRGEVEEILTGIWQELLRIERVSRHDNFFELGGHSLLVMKLSAKLSEHFEVTLSVPCVFINPTIAQLAAAVDSLKLTMEMQPSREGVDLEEGVL